MNDLAGLARRENLTIKAYKNCSKCKGSRVEEIRLGRSGSNE